MKIHEQDEIRWLTFDHFAEFPELKHAVFLRPGGVSEGPYASLNFGFRLGDKEQNVEANLKKVQNILGFSHYLFAKQVHGKKVVAADRETPMRIECDSLTTSAKDFALLIRHADCQAAIFYDPLNQAVANVHCGWRGSVKNIYKETVLQMGKDYGSKPEDLRVGISPSLGPQSAEFIHFEKELPPSFWKFQIKPTYFDFWEISRWQLEACGILPGHIEFAKIDTYTNADDCFSFRRSNRITGHHGTFVMLAS